MNLHNRAQEMEDKLTRPRKSIKDHTIEELEAQIREVENDTKITDKEAQIYLLMKDYKGADEVISSEDLPAYLEKQPPRINTGIHDLDTLTGGFGPENLVVLSGPTGQGKTLVAQHLTSWVAKDGHKSLWFSFELSLAELLERFQKFEHKPVFYTPKSNVSRSIVWIERKIIEGIAKFDTKFVFIDHTHYLLNMREMGRENTSLYLGDLVRELKLIARKYGIVIVLIHHLKKTSVLEAPTIDDLRDSSFVGQEADYVLICWRKPVVSKKKEMLLEGIRYTNETLLSVVKNRQYGKLGTATFVYKDGNLTPVYDPAR